MSAEDQPPEPSDSEISEWDVTNDLRSLSQSEIRLSKGLLRCDVSNWFSGIAQHWQPLFHALGAPFEWHGVDIELDRPEADRQWLFQIDGEPQVLTVPELTGETLANYVLGDSSSLIAADVQGYLVRRLLTSFSQTWIGPGSLQCSMLEGSVESANPVAWLTLHCAFSEVSCPVHIGLGARLVDRIDVAWREQYVASRMIDNVDDALHEVEIELAELSVVPAELIDYMRSGASIELDRPVSTDVVVRVDGAPWASGELCIYGGKFAVQISAANPATPAAIEGSTRVQIVLGSVQMDHQMLTEYEQPGAILLTRTPTSPRAEIVISGETVAHAQIASTGERFILHVLAK